jgi:hypothetical protein
MTMKILEIRERRAHFVDTDEGEYPHYIRFGPGNWMVNMGESYEAQYDDEILEAEYQRCWGRLVPQCD